MQDYTSAGLKKLAQETKTTKRLFRINASLYLYKGKFYKSDVFNIGYVTQKVKPSISHVNKNDTLYSVLEITDPYKLINIYNVR